MTTIVNAVLGVAFAGVVGFAVWIALNAWIRKLWPARIPRELAFHHELRTTLPLREVAEQLAERFARNSYPEVVCLGPVRGNAARLLFHSGPKNRGKNVNIHRADYLLVVRRVDRKNVVLELDTCRPYGYLRLNTKEVRDLRSALADAFGGLTAL
jgi:hypothetical protein